MDYMARDYRRDWDRPWIITLSEKYCLSIHLHSPGIIAHNQIKVRVIVAL